MADEYIEVTTDAGMEEMELAIGKVHDVSGALPLMGPRVYGSNCKASKLVKRQERLVSFRPHVDRDGAITREGGVLLVTPEVAALRAGDVVLDDGRTVRLDVRTSKLLKSELTVDGQKVAGEIEERAARTALRGG